MHINLATFTLLAYYLLTNLAAIEIESDDPNTIEDHSYEYYQVTRPDEIRLNCELDEMVAYGLSGDALSLGEKNEICPFISQNCCGKQDQAKIWSFWHRDRKRQEYYHRAVLKILKYFLGFGKEWNRIASVIIDDYEAKERGDKDRKNSSRSLNRNNNENEEDKKSFIDKGLNVNANKYCYKAAEYIVKLDFSTKEKAQAYYHMINDKTQFMEDARRGFYCVLCSVEGQAAVDTWMARSLNNFRYNDSFCNTMVNHSFRINYELYNTYNTYLSNLMKIMQCVSIDGDNNNNNMNRGGASNNTDYKRNKPPIELSKNEKKFIENPLSNDSFTRYELCNYGEGYIGLKACRLYCGHFNIAKPSQLLDLDMQRLKSAFHKILPYEEVLVSSRTNFFYDDLKRMKQDIDDNVGHFDRSKLFYKSLVQHIDISKYTTNFWVGTGIDPMEISRGNLLPINYKAARVMAVGVVLSLLGFL